MISEPVRGRVKDGKFTPRSTQSFKHAFRVHEGHEVIVNVKRFQAKRSPEANAYYWAVVVAYWMHEMKETDSKTMHLILKTAFNYKPVLVGEEVLRVPLSTADLKSGPFAEFVDKCIEGFRETYGGEIPPPSSEVSIEMMEEYNQLGNGRSHE